MDNMQFLKNLIPDKNNPIVKFNYYFSFDYMPKRIDAFNKGIISFEDLSNYNSFKEDLQIECMDLQKVAGKLLKIFVPSTKAFSETALVLVFISQSANKASMFTCEYSLDCYMVCSTSADGTHSNLGQINTLEEALDYCIDLLPKDLFLPIESNQTDEINLVAKEDDSFTIKSSTRTEDIYGDKLINRLNDILSVIQYGAEEMMKCLFEYPNKTNLSIVNLVDKVAKKLSAYPIPSEEGKMECQIAIASLLTRSIETEIVAKSLIIGSSSYFSINLNTLVEKLNNYYKMYETQVESTNVEKLCPLIEYAKINGSLKLATFNKKDKYGSFKRPVFISVEGTKKICHFSGFEEYQQTADFIVANKNNIFVNECSDGDIIFILKENLDFYKNYFFDFLLYKIYCDPLTYNNLLFGLDIDEGLKRMNISSNEINPNIEYAFNEGKKMLELIATSNGLIGTYNN